ncbi:hypothetical protein GOBAR_AA21929 [Gossypium barbadense]|uniref:VDE lipocalin domain-containing protein n=1 Tax=Gossypium barbadense TaxID=3634 RepID=A0A2P5X5W1_GOSBA|nr:hypothetical protein GOBAR_AA21929 [Gossypium barbadense]
MSLVLEPPPPPLSKSKTGAPLKRCFTSIRTALSPPNHRFRASRFPLHPTSSSRPTVTVVLKTEKEKNAVTEQKDPPVRIVAVVGQGSVSPLKCTPWEEVMMHTPVDQVCNYRCIASFESPKLEAFSLCVLQKNNCLDLDAKIPEKPYVQPMLKFRGKDLCHETAEDLFVGWMGSLDWSWRVVAGQNPAYDQFPCQYQLFYRGKAKGSFWYEPVFQVKTLEGELVWRRRKYRVKRANVPGTFYFSVLDNGVVSKEYWTIVDVSEDFSWGLFHYHGAARVAGQSYTGAVLVSPDGTYPKQTQNNRLSSALEKCGIKEWELYTVDNCACQDPPLGIPEGSSLHSMVDAKDQSWSSV